MSNNSNVNFKTLVIFTGMLICIKAGYADGQIIIPHIQRLISDSDLIVKAVVEDLDYGNDEVSLNFHLNNRRGTRINPDYDKYLEVGLRIDEVLKGDKHLSILKFPAIKPIGSPKPRSYEIGQRYLLFMTSADPNENPGYARSFPFCDIVHLNGDQIVARFWEGFGDDRKRIEYSESELLKRVRQLVAEGPDQTHGKSFFQKLKTHDWTSILEGNKYSTDSNEEIAKALKDTSTLTRSCALYLLTERGFKNSTEILKNALNDSNLVIRIQAAHLLHTLGDKSGLDQMQKDFKQSYILNNTTEPAEPNLNTAFHRMRVDRSRPKRGPQIFYLLQIAEVLAELGDRQGYELAVKFGINDSMDKNRLRSAKVLFEIAETDSATLIADNMNPTAVLSSAVKSEIMCVVFRYIVIRAAQTGGQMGKQILKEAMKNSSQPKEMLRLAKNLYEKLQKN